MKKYSTYIAIALVGLIGLNYYFSYSSARNLEHQMSMLSEDMPDSSVFRSGPVTILPFKGDVLLSSISYENKVKNFYAESKDIVLDLTYFDFLKIYFMGSQSAFRNINKVNIDFRSSELGLTIRNKTHLTIDKHTVYLEGSLLSFLQAVAAQKLPKTNLAIKSVLKNITHHKQDSDSTTNNLLLAKTVSFSSFYLANPGTFRIDSLTTSGGLLSTHFSSTISFNNQTEPTKIWPLQKLKFNTTLSYQNDKEATEDTPIALPTAYGMLSARTVNAKADLTSIAHYEEWFQNMVNLQGSYGIDIQHIYFNPATELENAYGFFMNPFREDNGTIPFHNFTLKGTSMPEFMRVEEMSLTHSLFKLNFKGRVLKNTHNFRRSIIQDGQLTMSDIDPTIKNLLYNATALAGFKIEKTGNEINFSLTGPINKPNISIK